MTLRLRLFLLLGGLVALLLGAEWWLIRSLASGLALEVEEVAVFVSRSVAEVVLDSKTSGASEDPDATDANPDPPPKRQRVEQPVEQKVEQKVTVHALRLEDGDPLQVIAGEGTTPQKIVVRLEKDEDAENKELVLATPALQRRIPLPSGSLNRRLEVFRDRLLLGTLLILATGLALAAAVAHRVTKPLRELSTASRRIGQGALGTQVAVRGSGEVGEALAAFNQMSRRLRDLDEQARQLRSREHLSELGEVARGLAHGLRNPLNALGLSVEELADEAVPATRRGELAASVRRQVQRIDHSIRSFLALASGGGRSESVDLGELTRDVVLEALQTGRGRVRIETVVAPELPWLEAVPPELRAVLQALVVNAVEASAEGGRVRVLVEQASAPEDRPRLRVVVEDEGPGVPPAVRERLFTPHVSTKAHGSGMGLYLAHRIATSRYGGSLRLEDRGGEPGTRAVLEVGLRIEGPISGEDSGAEDA